MITICSSFKLILQLAFKLLLCMHKDELKLWIAMQSNAYLKKERVLLSTLFVGNMIGSLFLLLLFLILVILVLLYHMQGNKRKKRVNRRLLCYSESCHFAKFAILQNLPFLWAFFQREKILWRIHLIKSKHRARSTQKMQSTLIRKSYQQIADDKV